MSSRRELILQAIVSALSTITGAKVKRSRVTPIAKNEGTIIIVRPSEEETGVETMGGAIERVLTVQVSVSARGIIPDSAADPVAVAIHQKVMADQRLDGLALFITEEGRTFAFDEADEQLVDVTINYLVTYRTQRNDESLAP